MRSNSNHITVFEHQTLRVGSGTKALSEDQLKALQQYYGGGSPFFSLCHKGVKFNEHVGVIQIGKTVIEVLPKADSDAGSESEETKWRNILIGMLKAVGSFNIRTTSESHLKTRSNTILDLYIEMFIKELEYLMHIGLVKKYRRTEGNCNALKGSLVFNKQITQNLTHQERFYVRHTTYDTTHNLHRILYKALLLVKQINTSHLLQSRIGSLLLDFPEMPDIHISESTFDKIFLSRKTQTYQKVLEISRLLLLQYHPDLTRGRNHVLALMFDMNKLWESYIYAMLHSTSNDEYTITRQNTRKFWQSDEQGSRYLKPDLLLTQRDGKSVVIDTKWKYRKEASIEDIRQMFAYGHYFDAGRRYLLYPDHIPEIVKTFDGNFSKHYCKQDNKWIESGSCGLMFVDLLDANGKLNRLIGENILNALAKRACV